MTNAAFISRQPARLASSPRRPGSLPGTSPTLNPLNYQLGCGAFLALSYAPLCFWSFSSAAQPGQPENSDLTRSNFKFLDNATLAPLSPFTISNLQLSPQIQTLPKKFNLGKVWSNLDWSPGESIETQHFILGNAWSSEVIFGNLDRCKIPGAGDFSFRCPTHKSGQVRFSRSRIVEIVGRLKRGETF
jgi:hypothetical protein